MDSALDFVDATPNSQVMLNRKLKALPLFVPNSPSSHDQSHSTPTLRPPRETRPFLALASHVRSRQVLRYVRPPILLMVCWTDFCCSLQTLPAHRQSQPPHHAVIVEPPAAEEVEVTEHQAIARLEEELGAEIAPTERSHKAKLTRRRSASARSAGNQTVSSLRKSRRRNSNASLKPIKKERLKIARE